MIGKKRSSLYRVNWTLNCTQDHIINIFTTLLWKRIIMYDNVVKMLIIWFCVHLRVQFTSQSEASFYLSSNYICVQIQKRKYLQEFKPVSIQSYITITFTTEVFDFTSSYFLFSFIELWNTSNVFGNPLPCYTLQMINPFHNSKISANHDKVEGFQPMLKSF